MKDLGGFDNYQANMADWTGELLRSLGNPLPEVTDFSEWELELFNEVFRRFAEISEAIENLELCRVFISARTPRRKSLKLDAYLNYHISFYLQEIYILKERLKKYATKIMRLRKRLGHRVDRDAYKSIIDSVEKSLSSIVAARGSHVHDRPFNDDDMKMLGAYSFLAVQQPSDPLWLKAARLEYAGVKQKWVMQLTKNQQDIQQMLHSFFAFLYSEVFESELLVLPNNSFKPRPLRGSA